MKTQLRAVKLDGAEATRRVEPLLRVQDLRVAYPCCEVLREISLDIGRGRITALIGPSGCGKSTLLSTMNRMIDLIPGTRVSGAIRLGDLDVLAPTTDVVALRRRVGMIFQKPNPFPLSIRKNLSLPLREHGVRKRADIEEATESALREVGLWEEVKDRLDRPALGLSGGQQQRLCIARALVLRPEVVLLDEPCSALDPIASGVVEDLIVSLRGAFTVVVVTHNLAQARRIADEVAVMWVCDEVGCVVESGSAVDVFENPTNSITAAYVSGARC